MPLQLDIATLIVMFITLALTAFIVMFLIWRINRDMPGVLHWMLATLLNTASALASLLQALAGGDNDWGLFLSNSISMAANVLVLEGALRFRGHDSKLRQQLFMVFIVGFTLLSWIYHQDPTIRDALHEAFTLTFQLLAGAVLIFRTSDRGELQANLLAAVSSILIGVLILWRLVWESSGNQLAVQGVETQSTQWFLFAAANLHIAWIFGLSVACYYRSRQQVMSLAREDALTALPNRRWIDEMLNQTLIEAKRSGEKFAVIMLDINKFKLVNDKFGHSAGDKVLAEVADRLRKAVRESDFAGRLGGDEFVVLARRIDSELLLTQMVDRIRHQLNGKMALSDEEIDIRVSIGTAVFPVEGDNADMLLGFADAGMYRDKKGEKKDS